MAIDLPGFARSKSAAGKLNSSSLLLDVVEKLDLKSSLVIVSPSMSGMYSLPFLVEHPERVKGYVPIAPIGTEKYARKFPQIFVSLNL